MFTKTDIVPFKKKVWLSSPTMHGDELKYMTEAFETNWMSTVGANINEVERMAAEFIGVKYAVALSCGTAALHLAVKLAGVKRGDRVFCSDMTFDATVNPVVYEGGVPVFIDTEYDTWNMDSVALEKAFELYPEVKVIVVAHLYGTPGKIDEIKAIADKHGAVIVEDAAESLGATYKGQQTGSFGNAGIISFVGVKTLITIIRNIIHAIYNVGMHLYLFNLSIEERSIQLLFGNILQKFVDFLPWSELVYIVEPKKPDTMGAFGR